MKPRSGDLGVVVTETRIVAVGGMQGGAEISPAMQSQAGPGAADEFGFGDLPEGLVSKGLKPVFTNGQWRKPVTSPSLSCSCCLRHLIKAVAIHPDLL